MNNLPSLPCLACGLVFSSSIWAADCSTRHPERFVEFFPNFSESKSFALSRTVLPLPLLEWVDGVDSDGRPVSGPSKTYLSSGEYWRWPTLNKFMENNDLLANISKQTKTEAVVDLYRDEIPGKVSFYFHIKAGCWKLWQYEVNPKSAPL